MEIRELTDPETKSSVCHMILRLLPEWFASEKAVCDYSRQVQKLPVFAAMDGETPIGFVAVKQHNVYTAEICVMGICPAQQGKGIGTMLIREVENFCISGGLQFMTVKTLDASAAYKPYERTRAFYAKRGFVPLEVLPGYWDEENPCLLMARHIACSRDNEKSS